MVYGEYLKRLSMKIDIERYSIYFTDVTLTHVFCVFNKNTRLRLHRKFGNAENKKAIKNSKQKKVKQYLKKI